MFHSCLVCFIWVHLGRSKNFLSNNKKIDFKIVVNENVEKKLIEKNDRKNIENFPELNRKKEVENKMFERKHDRKLKYRKNKHRNDFIEKINIEMI